MVCEAKIFFNTSNLGSGEVAKLKRVLFETSCLEYDALKDLSMCILALKMISLSYSSIIPLNDRLPFNFKYLPFESRS